MPRIVKIGTQDIGTWRDRGMRRSMASTYCNFQSQTGTKPRGGDSSAPVAASPER